MKLNLGLVAVLRSPLLGIAFLGCLLFFAHFLIVRLSPPAVIATYPVPNEIGVPGQSRQTLRFNKRMDPASINSKTLILYDAHNHVVPARVAYEDSANVAILSPSGPLSPATPYRLAVAGGKDGIKDSFGRPLPNNLAWTFTTGVKAASPPTAGPGGPLLLITSSANGFTQYYAEILRNEGFNEFQTLDISRIDSDSLQGCEIAVLGEMLLDEKQIATLSHWVEGGGDLIAMRPDVRLARALGFQIADPQDRDQSDPPLHDAYLSIQPNSPAGAGLVHEPIQFHGPAAPYSVANGAPLATLYSDATTPTSFPAITKLAVGQGQVVLFSYDLARSVVYTRQGNPAWSATERDGIPPVRSDDLFYGASTSDPQPDWVDPHKLPIPQADIQQRLFANLLTLASVHKMPLPHFWYLPRGIKAAVIMTGDDHGMGGTIKRFKGFLDKSPQGCSVENWECIRATSNVFVGSIPSSQAPGLVAEGFEIGLHVYTGCTDWPTRKVPQPDGSVQLQVDRDRANGTYGTQLAAFASRYPGVPPPVSNRIDCVTWGDYDSQPQIELNHGIRLDTNYYYWPAKWVRNRPGLFTGSALPMRFARRDGTIIDVYQVATQMTDESSQPYPSTVDALLANALGPSEFYGVLTANMHNDQPKSPQADAVISAALYNHVPVITAAQMLKWLDGRNTSSFQNLAWSAGRLTFHIDIGENANGLQVLMPISSEAGDLVSVTADGAPVPYQRRSITGLAFAAFPARPGNMQATYRQSPKAKPE